VIGRLAGRSLGAPARQPPDLGDPAPGRYWVRLVELSLPCSTSCMAATEVIALVIEAMRKTVSSVIAGVIENARAKRTFVEQPLVGPPPSLRRQAHPWHRHLAEHAVKRARGSAALSCASGGAISLSWATRPSSGGEDHCPLQHVTRLVY